jgi:hypothetical protein
MLSRCPSTELLPHTLNKNFKVSLNLSPHTTHMITLGAKKVRSIMATDLLSDLH